MKRILLIATVFFTSILSAQDWAPFKASDTLVQFKDDSICFKSLGPVDQPIFSSFAIQSLSVNSTSTVGNLTTIVFEKGYPLMALNPWFPSLNISPLAIKGRILGDTAYISADTSRFKTIDTNGYSLTFPHRYKLNQVWRLGKSNSSTIYATVDSIYFDSVGQFGVDSLVQVRLTVLDDSNIVVPNHKLHNIILLISKHYGIIKTIDFSDLYTFRTVSFERYYLSNSPFTNNDYSALTTGDEYHYNYLFSINSWPSENTDHIAKIIADNTSGTTRTITIQDSWVNRSNNTYGQKTVVKTFDISEVACNKKSMIVNDSIITNRWGTASILFHTNNFQFSNLIEYKTWYSVFPGQNQNELARIDFRNFASTFFTTFGPIGFPFDLFESNNQNGIPESEETILTYIKKGNQTWGTPFTFVGLEENSANDNSIQLYPNPVKDVLNINNSSQLQHVRIFTIDGKLQLESKNSTSIDVSQFQAGLYLIEMNTDIGILTKRLIKE
jgi:hypothetical protein